MTYTLDCGSFFEVNHPQVGHLLFHQALFPMPEQPELHMIVYTPPAEEDTPAKLSALLAQEGNDDKMRWYGIPFLRIPCNRNQA